MLSFGDIFHYSSVKKIVLHYLVIHRIPFLLWGAFFFPRKLRVLKFMQKDKYKQGFSESGVQATPVGSRRCLPLFIFPIFFGNKTGQNAVAFID